MHRHAAFFHALFIKKQYSTAETDLMNVGATMRLIYGYVVSFSISCPIAIDEPCYQCRPQSLFESFAPKSVDSVGGRSLTNEKQTGSRSFVIGKFQHGKAFLHLSAGILKLHDKKMKVLRVETGIIV